MPSTKSSLVRRATTRQLVKQLWGRRKRFRAISGALGVEDVGNVRGKAKVLSAVTFTRGVTTVFAGWCQVTPPPAGCRVSRIPKNP